MKAKLLLPFFLFLTAGAFAQEEFSFELYFEDAMGNKDTLVLGYDDNATDSIDASFGEVNISSQPWDGIFEVKAMSRNSFHNLTQQEETLSNCFQTKHQIAKKRCDYNFPISLVLKAENMPIQIYWDSSLFNNPCLNGSIIYNSYTFQCDVITPNDVFMSNDPDSYGTYASNQVFIQDDYFIQSYNGVENLYFLWITFADIDSIQQHLAPGCPGWVGIESTYNNKVKIYPNPVIDNRVLISSDNVIREVQFVAMNGTIVHEINNLSQKQLNIHTDFLKKNTYLLKIKTDNEVIIKLLIIS